MEAIRAVSGAGALGVLVIKRRGHVDGDGEPVPSKAAGDDELHMTHYDGWLVEEPVRGLDAQTSGSVVAPW